MDHGGLNPATQTRVGRINAFMKQITVIFTFLFLVSFAGASEWVSLFDGETLNGWTKRGGDASYAVQDGAIVGINGPNHNTFLCTNRTYGDFELEFDVYLKDGINSGVQIRSKVRREAGPDSQPGEVISRVYGPQVEIERSPGESGYLYGERIGGWMTPDVEFVPHEVFRNGAWNHYRVVATGPRIQVFINDEPISDLVDESVYADHVRGFIGLQVHQSKLPDGSARVRWKNLRVRELDPVAWIPLFNGENLDGWTPKVTGHAVGENPGRIFRVEDGTLKVSYDAFEAFAGRFGHLFINYPYSRYLFRMEYRFVGEQAAGGPAWGRRNSGVMVHGPSPYAMGVDQKFPDSIEVQLLGADQGEVRSTGNVCTPGTMIHVDGELFAKHCLDSNSESFAGDQWVQLEILVNQDKEITHYINGAEVLRYQGPVLDDGTPLRSGSISLQAESHGCEFRTIEIKPM